MFLAVYYFFRLFGFSPTFLLLHKISHYSASSSCQVCTRIKNTNNSLSACQRFPVALIFSCLYPGVLKIIFDNLFGMGSDKLYPLLIPFWLYHFLRGYLRISRNLIGSKLSDFWSLQGNAVRNLFKTYIFCYLNEYRFFPIYFAFIKFALE